MRPNIYWLLLICITLNACVSKKYGRHFQNDTSGSAIICQEKPIIQQEPQLIAAASLHSKIPVLEVDDYADVQTPKPKTVLSKRNHTSVEASKPADILDQKAGRLKSSSGRKLEPLGLGAFGLFVISSLIGVSMGFTPMLLVLIGIAMVVGGVSVYRVRSNKKRFKGAFFGSFVVIAGVLLLTMLGIDALIQSIFGNS